MSYKNEKRIHTYSVEKDKSNAFYVMARQYVSIDDITKTESDERATYRIAVKNKNLVKFLHDIRLMHLCGLDIRAERS